jgi:membrane protease YdiL (CAAX protease family)
MKTRVIQHSKGPTTAPGDSAATESPARTHDRKPHGRFRTAVDRHPLVAFFVLAFALTWFTIPMGSFMAAGPLLASLIVLGMTEGRSGLRELWQRVVRWRIGWPWYAVALALPLVVGLSAGKLNVALGASDAAFTNFSVSAMLTLFALRMVMPVFAPVGEEPAWRGYALPRMQRVHTPFAATLFLGLFVAAWHGPLLLLSDVTFEPVMLLGTVFVTFWYTWLFNHTGGSVFITIVAHAADGIVGEQLLKDGGFHGDAERRFIYLYCAAWLVVATVLVVADRRRWFSPVTDPALVEGTERDRPARRRIAAGAVATMVTATVVLGAVGVASATTATKAPSHDTYVEQADEICNSTVDKVDAVVEDVGLDPSDEDAREAARKVVALQRAELRDLRALPTPAKDAAEIATVYRAMDKGWNRVERKPSVLFDEPGPLEKATDLASDYGFEVCGRG